MEKVNYNAKTEQETINAELLEQCEIFLQWMIDIGEVIPLGLNQKLPAFNSKRLRDVIAKAKQQER